MLLYVMVWSHGSRTSWSEHKYPPGPLVPRVDAISSLMDPCRDYANNALARWHLLGFAEDLTSQIIIIMIGLSSHGSCNTKT